MDMIMNNEKKKSSKNTKRRKERKANMDRRIKTLFTKNKQAKKKKGIDKLKKWEFELIKMK